MIGSQRVVEPVMLLEHEHATMMGGGDMKRGTGRRHHTNYGKMKLEGTQALGVPE